MRPTKLNADVHKEIVDAIAAGAYAEVAAEYAGIAKATYYRWMQRGDQARTHLEHPPLPPDFPDRDSHRAAKRAWAAEARRERPYREFRDAVTRAGARAEVRAVATLHQTIQSAVTPVMVGVRGGGQRIEYVPDHNARTRASVEFLRRRFPDRWTDRQRIETDQHVTVERSGGPLTPEQEAAIDAILMAEAV